MDMHSSTERVYTGDLVEYSLPKIGASWSMEPGDSLFLDYTDDSDRVTLFAEKIASGNSISKKAASAENKTSTTPSASKTSGPVATPSR